MTGKQKKNMTRIIVSACLTLIFIVFDFEKITGCNENLHLNNILLLIPYFVIGYDILLKAVKGIKNLEPFDENFLMAIASVGAILLGESLESIAVVIFYQIGELFESIAVGKSRRNIKDLMDICPDKAFIQNENGEIEETDPSCVEIGTVILVRPGEKIPIDGVIVEGCTSVDTKALTGESFPVDVDVSQNVKSGFINLSSPIKIKTTKLFSESTASRIMELVENAGAKKSKSENFISKFAKYYTPIVCMSAVVLAFIVPLCIILFAGGSPSWSKWIYRALTFLVISCPCALVISVPLSFFAGIGKAGSEGILIKGSSFIEKLSKVKCVVLDKTGTLTKGVFEICDIHHNSIEREKLIEMAALAESFSNHPISISLQKAYGKEADKSRVKDVREIGGKGIVAYIDGKKVLVGNSLLMKDENIEYIDCHSVGTIVHVAVDGRYEGHIVIADVLKDESMEAVASLKKLGVRKTVMLTGDAEKLAEKISRELMLDEFHSNLLPEDKVRYVEKFISEKEKNEYVAFVGDGLNDAPVLAMSDVGIAMGALGSDAAIESADVVLMDDNPLKIVRAVKLSRKCMNIVFQNIVFALSVKFACLLLSASGSVNMWIAIFADVGVMIIAVLNSLRNLFQRK